MDAQTTSLASTNTYRPRLLEFHYLYTKYGANNAKINPESNLAASLDYARQATLLILILENDKAMIAFVLIR
jgi:hypothetical protein